jgi:hypothetical protein
LVCTLLVVVDLAAEDPTNSEVFIGLHWAFWSVIGWGVFVAIHGIKTFFGLGGWEKRKTKELYEREKRKEQYS